MVKERKENFCIGFYHGKTLSEGDEREYKIQRDLYLIGKVMLNFSHVRIIDVRIFAYEVPLEQTSRGESIDLLGYDKDFNVYIFELKRTNNKDSLQKIVTQINGYAKKLIDKLPVIQNELRKAFLFDSIVLNIDKVEKVILAPRGHYDKEMDCIRRNPDIRFGYFGSIRDKKATKLLESRKRIVNINFQK